jgi:S-disulfanyl-L-cysteine oxidoreductase SoxD
MIKQRDTRYRRRPQAGAAAAVAIVGAAVGWAQSADGPTLAEGVFSRAQVERGEESFVWECMDCHEIEEFTGVGAYLEGKDGATLWEVFEYVWLEMPEDRPAWLDPEEYADILAYILSVYGHPAGDADLPTHETALKSILITRPDRPGS